MRCFIACILFIATHIEIQGQVNEVATPFSGMAGADGALFSPWAVYSNQAGVAQLSKAYAGISYRAVSDLKELNTKSIFVINPSAWGVYGVTYTHFGMDYYNEQLMGGVFSRRLSEWLNIGGKIDYLLVHVDKQPNNYHAFFFELGFLFTLPSDINIGVHGYNPGKISRLTAPNRIYVAEKYTLSSSWKVDKMFTLCAQGELLDRKFIFSGGVEFSYYEFLNIRCGYRSQFDNVYAGVEVIWKRLSLSLNYNSHPVWGGVTGVCLSIYF